MIMIVIYYYLERDNGKVLKLHIQITLLTLEHFFLHLPFLSPAF